MANVRLQFAESLLSFQHNSYSVYVSERPCNEITYVKRRIHLDIRLNIRIEEFQGNECLAFSARNVYSFIHSFIHSGHFYSAPSSPLLLRGLPTTARILYRSFTPKRTGNCR